MCLDMRADMCVDMRAQDFLHNWCDHVGAKVSYADVTGDGLAELMCDDEAGNHWMKVPHVHMSCTHACTHMPAYTCLHTCLHTHACTRMPAHMSAHACRHTWHV